MEFDLTVVTKYWGLFARGLGITLLVITIGILASLLLGLIVAVGRLSRNPMIRAVALIYIEFSRNLPFMVILYLFFFGLPAAGLHLSTFLVGAFALTVYGAAYYAEIYRGAIQSVPKGQTESARAVGMSYVQALRYVILPQMMGYFVPPATNQAIMLVKESAVLSTITVVDLTMAAQIIQGYTYSPVEVFLVISIVYWLLTTGIARTGRMLEKATSRYRLRRPVTGAAAPDQPAVRMASDA